VSYYEILVIFSTNLTEDEEKAQASQVEDLIRHEKGTIHLVEHWGKRKLAYPIKKQRQGHYEWYYAELDPARTSEIDRKLKMSETILRFLIFKMEKIQIGNLHREIARRQEAAAAASAQHQEPEVAPAEPAVTPPAEEPAAETVQEEIPAATDDVTAEATPDAGQE
jgi:small subunit ribosomal protein S6